MSDWYQYYPVVKFESFPETLRSNNKPVCYWILFQDIRYDKPLEELCDDTDAILEHLMAEGTNQVWDEEKQTYFTDHFCLIAFFQV